MMIFTNPTLCPHGRNVMLLIDSGAVRQAEPCEVCDRVAALALYQLACEAWGLVGRLAARDLVLAFLAFSNGFSERNAMLAIIHAKDGR